jgi:hypothetical protein
MKRIVFALSVAALALPLSRGPLPAAERQDLLSPEIRSTVARLQKEALAGTRSFEIVRSLTVEVGPRLAGTAGFTRAVEWGARTLKELGFANVRTEKVMLPHWERGAESGEIVAPYPQPEIGRAHV